jgi:hypothetical protein
MKHLIALLPMMMLSAVSSANTAYGTLNNFDVVNDTGQVCYGFEIELEDLGTADITYTYDYNHYGTPTMRQDDTNPAHPKVVIRYDSRKDATGHFIAYTAMPTAPVAPTDGHQCTNPSVNFGCEHFGVGYLRPPTVVRYHWLVDDGTGTLVRGPAVNISTPTWTYFPPAAGQAAQVQAAIVAPEPPEIVEKEFGEAVWVKVIKTTSHSNRPVELRDLVADDPDDPDDENWTNGEPDEVETEWHILQTEFSKPGEGNDELLGANEELPDGDEVVTRRYEFYEYAGPYDEETNEILCDEYPDPLPAPECAVELVGNYIGSQMAGFNVEAVLGLIDHLQDGAEGEPYPERRVVVGGNTPYVTTVTTGSLPDALALDSASGVLSGTPTTAGSYEFTVEATDADGVSVSKAYALAIVAAAVTAPGDADEDGDIDLNDLILMRGRFGQLALPGDLADVNGDGRINVLDYRKAITQCTRPRCAVE